MRKLWLTTFTALCCAAGFSASAVLADPASMAMPGRNSNQQAPPSTWPWTQTTTTTAPPAMSQSPYIIGQPPQPQDTSFTHHPIDYFKTNISKKFGSGAKTASAPRPTMPPATNRAVAASPATPTGPPSPEFFIFAAQTCEQQGDVPQARKNFQNALNIWPGQVEVLRAAARMEDRQGNLPLAENLYQQAVTANPQHAGAMNDLGLCLAREGKLQPSLQVLEQAVQLQPTKALYRNNAATVLVEMHQDQRALAHLSAVHNAADANYNLGQLLIERGRSADAAPFFQAAVQANPAMQQAQVALAKLQGSQMTVSTPVASTQPVAAQAPIQAGQPIAAQQPGIAAQQVNYPAPAAAGATAGAVEAMNSPAPQYLPPVASRPVGIVR
jgi:tetratricopeptide (TPR) repeat protein